MFSDVSGLPYRLASLLIYLPILGKLGISKLSLMIKEVILMPRYRVDSRSYSAVVGSTHTNKIILYIVYYYTIIYIIK